MNKLFKATLAGFMAFGLVGCSDASAKLSDSSTALFKVGKTSVTKGDVYSTMVSMSGAATAINDATNAIATAEVEITEEIQAQAESTLSIYKSLYGDSFLPYLEQINMTEEEYLNEYLIPSLLASELTNKYIDEKWDDLVTMYKPKKSTVLEFTSYDDLTAALSELNTGDVDVETVVSNHNGTLVGSEEVYTNQSTELDSMVRAVLSSISSEDGWTEANTSDGSTYTLVRVDEDDPENFRDELIELLAELDTIESDATTYFFRKHNFHIYDINLYNSVSASYPDNLVQNLPETEDAE